MTLNKKSYKTSSFQIAANHRKCVKLQDLLGECGSRRTPFRCFAGLGLLAVLFFLGACTTTSGQLSKQSVIYKDANSTDYEKLEALIGMHKLCNRILAEKPNEPRPAECSTRFGEAYGLFQKEYGIFAEPGVIIVPFTAYMGRYPDGLLPTVNNGFRFCGRLYNLSEKSISAIEVSIGATDQFDQLMGLAEKFQASFVPAVQAKIGDRLGEDSVSPKIRTDAPYAEETLICSAVHRISETDVKKMKRIRMLPFKVLYGKP